MSFTKREFIQAAFDELGLTESVGEEAYTQALKRLDSMIAQWNKKGIKLGYPLPNSPEDSSLDDESNVPDMANEAIITGLAVKVGPSFGLKGLTLVDTKKEAQASFKVLLAQAIEMTERQLPSTLPRGAGYKTHRGYKDTYFRESDSLSTGTDGFLEY